MIAPSTLDIMSIEWLLALALAMPHLLYGFIWFFPSVWRRWFGNQSVLVFDSVAWVLKGEADTSFQLALA